MATDAPGSPAPVTIYDVARAAGVSASTVSRTFSRPGRVNSVTAENIRRTAREMGYRANPAARALSTAHANVIAILVTNISNPYFGDVTRGVQNVAVEEDYTLQLIDTLESGQREQRALNRSLGADGLILTSPRTSDEAILTAAKQRPVVLINRTIRGLPSVSVDDGAGTRLAVDHLAGQGHERLLYLAGPADSWVDGVRWRSFLDRATALGIPARRVGPYPATIEGGTESAREILGHRHAGVVAYNDQMAIGLLRGIRRAGRSVPADMCVVGYDNIFADTVVTPTLTSVAAPLRELGSTAARLLLNIIAGRSAGSAQIVLPCTLVVRESTTPHTGRTSVTRPRAARAVAVRAHR